MIQILSSSNICRRILTEPEAESLKTNEFCPESQDLLKRLNERQHRVRCRCGVIMHTVFNSDNQGYFLRKNPSQDIKHKNSCPFLKREIFHSLSMSSAKDLYAGPTDLLLISGKIASNKKESPETAGQGKPQMAAAADNGSQKGLRHKKVFEFLYGMFHQLGINRYPNEVLGRPANWDDIYDFLQKTRYRDLFWCPSVKCSGGAVGLNQKIIRNWNDPTKTAHGLLFGIIDEIPVEDRLLIPKFQQDKYPVKSRFDIRRASLVGESGPYFVIAVCVADPDGKAEYSTPTISKIAMQAIKSWNSWIPTEKDSFRTVANRLFAERQAFYRPLLPEGNGPERFRPDFILPGRCVLDSSSEGRIKAMASSFKIPVVQLQPGQPFNPKMLP